jgi:hypothetical protein
MSKRETPMIREYWRSVGQALMDGAGDCPLRLRRGLAERFIEIPRDSLPSS